MTGVDMLVRIEKCFLKVKSKAVLCQNNYLAISRIEGKLYEKYFDS
jgi:hypothetical protein